MPEIKSMDRIGSKWKTVAGRSSDTYSEGVKNPRKSWKKATQAANSNWEQGTQQAISRKSFKAGVDKSSDETWQDGAINKGVSRYSAGVELGQANYEKGFAPFAQVIAATNLPERKPKGDPANITRVSVMAKALHDKKLSLSGVSTK